MACTSGQELEIPLHSQLAYGNIKTISFRFQTAAHQTGASSDCLEVSATDRVSTFKLEINGEVCEELESQLEVDLEQYLQGFIREEGIV